MEKKPELKLHKVFIRFSDGSQKEYLAPSTVLTELRRLSRSIKPDILMMDLEKRYVFINLDKIFYVDINKETLRRM